MKVFEYSDKELELFYSLGSLLVDLKTEKVEKVPFSVFETSTGPEDIDYPFDAQKVTVRPGLWYALNLAVGGVKKQAIIQTTKEIREMASQFGAYEISFVIVLPPGSTIPHHRHFRKFNSLTYCIPATQTEGSLEIVVGDKSVHIKKGYIHFDSKQSHSAINRSDTTYWIFVFENVKSDSNPQLSTKEI